MAVTLVGVTSGSSGLSAVSTLARAVPVGTALGDRLFASVTIANELSVITPPSGWTQVSLPVNITDHAFRLYTKIASSSEPPSYSWNFSISTSATIAITAVRGLSSFFATCQDDGVLALLSHSAPQVNVASPSGSALLCIFSAQSVLSLGWSAPSGMTEHWDSIGGIPILLNSTQSGHFQGSLSPGLYTKTSITLTAVSAINVTIVLEAAAQIIVTGAGSEMDIANSLVPFHAQTIDQATEAEIAQSISPAHRVSMGSGFETETVESIRPRRQVPIGIAMEVDDSTSILPNQTGKINIAEATDTALSVDSTHQVGISDPFEWNTAAGISPNRVVTLNAALYEEGAFDHSSPSLDAPAEEFSIDTFSGPCDPWPVVWRCDLTGQSPEITGIALEAATEMLYHLTAQQFGTCTVKLRPCREECYEGGGWPSLYGGYPRPALIDGQWYNLTCGSCLTGCSCTFISEVFLPGPVAEILEVKVDGVVLTAGTDYRLDDYRKLVRLGATWPRCNDLNKDDTEIGAWSVTARFGSPVPALGKLAVGELACDFLAFLTGGDCNLPNGITEISRQGITMSFDRTSTDLLAFFNTHPVSYMFVKAFNPNNLMARAKAYDLDGPSFRLTGT